MDESLKFDLRLIERNLRSGLISDREYQAFLRDLKDLDGNYDETPIEDLVPKTLIARMVGGEELNDKGKSGKNK
jgi:hypothetical protein